MSEILFSVRMNKDVVLAFRRAIEDKHETRHGMVREETEKALTFWTKVLKGDVDLPG